MIQSDDNSGFAGRIEFLARRFFERVGGAIDFSLRRGERASTDLSALTPQIERAIESYLQDGDEGIIAPNLIELRYDYETYTRMGQDRRDYLERELSSSIFEYIYNRRYKTLHNVRVRVGYDAFTRGMEIRLDVGDPASPVILTGSTGETDDTESPPVAESSCKIMLKDLRTGIELESVATYGQDPVGLGRNSVNDMVINDPTVSNFHAGFKLRSDGQVEVGDRASANGTFVNGVMLGTGDNTIVRDGDRVKFGDVEMILSLQFDD